MKLLRIVLGLTLVAFLFTQCQKDEMTEPTLKKGELPDVVPAKMFTVIVKNVSTPFEYFAAGAVTIPDGEAEAGPALQGQSFTVSFHAGPGHKLSFATMYGASNDWFYAPDDEGIALFDSNKNPLFTNTEEDITDMVHLWDAGTEVDGSMDSMESNPIELVSNTEENLQAFLTYDNVSMFTLTINVLPNSATPLSPVAWVVHSEDQEPIFTESHLDRGMGLEALAETGNPGPLSAHLKMHSGYVSPVAPVLWVVHEKGDMPIFTKGSMDRGLGLDSLAETGNPHELVTNLISMGYNAGAYAVPDGSNEAGPLFPGDTYTFSFDAKPGQYLSIASMLGKSNDEFFAFGDNGVKLAFGNGGKDITGEVLLWDAGTEMNEYPGAGIHQGGPEGPNENGQVKPLMHVNDGFWWPSASQVIKVTIHKNKN